MVNKAGTALFLWDQWHIDVFCCFVEEMLWMSARLFVHEKTPHVTFY